jgi:hypothetical protein
MQKAAQTVYVSASQVSTYRECARKWAWKYIGGIKAEQTEAQKLGDEVEKEQIGPYLTQDRAFDFARDARAGFLGSGYIAAAGLKYLPAPKTPGTVLQKKLEFRSSSAPFIWVGYLDCFLPNSSALPSPEKGDWGNAPCIVDFKTTKDFRYIKKEAVLRKDPQAVLYSVHVISETDADYVDLQWTYFRTQKSAKAERTAFRFSGEATFEQFDGLEKTGTEIYQWKTQEGVSPKDLPPNPEVCELFGGCPFRDKCNLSPAEKAKAWVAHVRPQGGMIMGASSVLAKLKASKAAQTSAEAPAQAAPPKAEQVEEKLPEWADPEKTDSKGKPLGINPPEKDLPQAAPVGQVEAPVPEKKMRAPRAAKVEAPAQAQTVSGPLPSIEFLGVSKADLARAFRAFADALEAS